MACLLQPNGTIGCWNTPSGVNILYPETQIVIGDERKLRGGAPVCCPNFGTAPTDGPYQDVVLPKHGLVRTCRVIDGQPAPGNRAARQSPPMLGGKYGGWDTVGFHFANPWSHDVRIWAKTSSEEGKVQLRHRILLQNTEIEASGIRMPYSIGFHPYFATGGGEWLRLKHGPYQWDQRTLEAVEVHKPFFVHHHENEPFAINTPHGSAKLVVVEGYNGFFVWSDRPDLYICIEPVCIGMNRRYRMLEPGDQVACECSMTYTPNA